MERRVRIDAEGPAEGSDIARLVQIANRYASTVYIEMDDAHRVNAKSIMGMMNLLSAGGMDVTIQAEGEDEEEAVEVISACLTRKE